jgi:hypothetical protein
MSINSLHLTTKVIMFVYQENNDVVRNYLKRRRELHLAKNRAFLFVVLTPKKARYLDDKYLPNILVS